MDVDLSCAGCPRGAAGPLPPWASARGDAGCLSWLEPDTRLGEDRLLDRPPTIGGRYSMLVRHPFRARIGFAQWALFEPAAPWREGWGRHGDRLAELALVRIEPLGFIGTHAPLGGAEQQSGWLEVRVVEVILAPDIPRSFPAVRRGALGHLLSDPWPANETTVVEKGELVFYERALTADIGAWALCRQSALTPPVVLAVGEWGFHEASFVAGHRPLSRAEARIFQGRWP